MVNVFRENRPEKLVLIQNQALTLCQPVSELAKSV